MGDIILMALQPHPTWFYHQPCSSVLYIVCFVPRCCFSANVHCMFLLYHFCTLGLLFNKRNLIGRAIHFAQTFPARVMFRNRNSGKKRKTSSNALKYSMFFFCDVIRLFSSIYLDCENCFKPIIVCLRIPLARVI